MMMRATGTILPIWPLLCVQRLLMVLRSVLPGSGAQLFAMAAATLSFALLGFMSPANRGGLLTSLLLLFVFMGKYSYPLCLSLCVTGYL